MTTAERVQRLLIGGYTTPRGSGSGISLVEYQGGDLRFVDVVAETSSPSALAQSANGSVIFAVEEADVGAVHSFRWAGSRLELVSSQPSGGADPCHLLVHPSGRFLFVANYTSGSVSVLPVDEDGVLGAATDHRTFYGSGPNLARQTQAHAHQVVMDPLGDGIVVVDLGSDRLHRLGFDRSDGSFSEGSSDIALPAGSGPRQLVLDVSGKHGHVLGELDSSLTTLDWANQSILETQPGALAPVPANNLAATLERHGGMLLASHRGADVVTRFALVNGHPEPVIDYPSGGQGPRHFAVQRGVLYIANEISGNLVARSLHDPAHPVVEVAVPSPTFVLPVA